MIPTTTLVHRYVTTRTDTHQIRPSTARQYRQVLGRFAAAMPDDPARIKRRHVEQWLASRRVAPGTLRSEFATGRTFLRWLIVSGYLGTDPTLAMTAPKAPDYHPRALTAQQVRAVYEACPTPRVRVIVTFMAQLGLRCAEVAALTVADIDRRRGIVHVTGKGGKVRVLPIVDALGWAMDRYEETHPATAGPYITSTTNPGHPISPRWVSELVGRTFVDAGLKVHARDGRSAHALRHTCLSDVLDAGADIRAVQAIAGHASISTTQVYLRGRDAAALRPLMEGRIYRAA